MTGMNDLADEIADRLHRARIASFLSDGGEPPIPLGESELEALVQRTAKVYSQAISPSTRGDYVRRWKKVEAWCEMQGFEAIPMRPEVLLVYLAAQIDSDAGMSLSTARGIASAVGRVHRGGGRAAPE